MEDNVESFSFIRLYLAKLRLLGVNAAELNSKLFTFKKIISELQPSIFFVEETKYKVPGKLKIENFFIFERVRETKDGGGGLALGVAKDLKPVWVREGNDSVEALSVEITVKNMNIRCCVAYGCQETENIEKKQLFWQYLDQDVIEAK